MACMDGLLRSMLRIVSGLFNKDSIIGELMICCISSGFRMSCSCILFMSPSPPSWLTIELRSARPVGVDEDLLSSETEGAGAGGAAAPLTRWIACPSWTSVGCESDEYTLCTTD